MKINLEAVNALAELERLGYSWESAGENEIRCLCPAHEDKTPSVNLNIEKNVWQCHAAQCKAKGDIFTFIGLVLNAERSLVIHELKQRYDLEEVKTISQATVEKFHEAINEAGPLLVELRKRGVTPDLIRKARLGFFNGRITIPIFDRQGRVLNIRRYLPGAPGSEKMKNTKGYGAARIYQPDQLERYEKVWFCGGEMKALVAGGLLNEHNVGAFCIAAGEGAWNPEWNSLLKGKTIYVCMDVDAPGKAATQHLCRALVGFAKEVRIIKLPLDVIKHPKGDINDYVGQEKAGASDLLSLMETAELFSPAALAGARQKDEKPLAVTLDQAILPENVGRLVEFEAVVFGYFETPYYVPKTVEVSCSRSTPHCQMCTIFPMEDPAPQCTLSPTSGSLLRMIGAGEQHKEPGIRDALGIPPQCKAVRFFDKAQYSVYDVRVSPKLELTATSGGNTARHPAYIIDSRVESNSPYVMRGVTYPHPRDQSAIILVDQLQASNDGLDTFSPTKPDLEALESVFNPADWSASSIGAKLKELYSDLAFNVTGIFGREAMHLAIDLTFHSPLFMTFEGRTTKGWLNSVIVGDSGQGKTEASSNLLAHYALGRRIECKNASTAGLVGGLQQIGSRWFITWGVIPQEDRRLVVLEEAKGLPTTEIARMTDMRSSGVAELPKIEHGRANARTRLMFISNPRASRPIASYSFGIEAIFELIGSLEDIRRFDLAIILSQDQIDSELMHKKRNEREFIEHKATAELCRRAILFGWTRKPNQVLFDPDAEDLVQEVSLQLTKDFSDQLPLLDRGTTRQKIARLSAALAIRTFSHEDFSNVKIRTGHVEYIDRFIRQVYSDPRFGYLDYSRVHAEANSIPDVDEVKEYLRQSKFPYDIVSALIRATDITAEDISSFFEVDRDQAITVLSFFVRKHCIFRDRRAYKKTEPFILLLKSLKKEFAGLDGPDTSNQEF